MFCHALSKLGVLCFVVRFRGDSEIGKGLKVTQISIYFVAIVLDSDTVVQERNLSLMTGDFVLT